MKKIQLEIVGLSFSQTQSGAYALVLGEMNGKRRLPIIIGGFEAQAIAIEIEKIVPSRPLTHDLFKSLAQGFNIDLKEVLIYNLVEGVFYARIICSNGENEIEIDARTSDAIALAVRFNCPVYTFEFILSQAGVILEEGSVSKENEEFNLEEELVTSQTEGDFSTKSDKELNKMLQDALDEEDYEKASKIRDELNKRSGN
ncbi:MAG: bifunctional nuclease domain-containing protein [Bacteroidia bacterium]